MTLVKGAMFIASLTIVGLIGLQTQADGQGAGATDIVNDQPSNSQSFVFNYGPGPNPALNLLGVSPSKAQLSSTPQSFLISLPVIYGGSGDQTVGLEVSPFWLFHTTPLISKLYSSTNPAAHILYNAQLEIAETTGQSSTTPSKINQSGIAIGLFTSLLSSADPLATSEYVPPPPSSTNSGPNNASYSNPYNVGRTFYDYCESSVPALNNENIVQLSSDYSSHQLLLDPKNPNYDKSNQTSLTQELNNEGSAITKYAALCSQAAADIANVSPDITAGFGYRDAGKPGTLTALSPGGESEWLSARYPIPLPGFSSNIAQLTQNLASNPSSIQQIVGSGKTRNALSYAMLGGSFQAQQSAALVTGNAKTPIIKANAYSGWLGLEANSPMYQLGFEGGYTDTMADDPTNKKFSSNGWRWLVTTAFQLPDFLNPISQLIGQSQTWVNVSYGTAHGTTTQLKDRTFLVSLSFSPPAQVASLAPSSGSSGTAVGSNGGTPTN